MSQRGDVQSNERLLIALACNALGVYVDYAILREKRLTLIGMFLRAVHIFSLFIEPNKL